MRAVLKRYRLHVCDHLPLVFADFLAFPVSLWLALCLHSGTFVYPVDEGLWIYAAAPMIAIPVFVLSGIYRAAIRYIGYKTAWTIIRTVSLSILIWYALILFSGESDPDHPATIIFWLVSILFISGNRMVGRFVLSLSGNDAGDQINVAIYGAGVAGVQLAEALRFDKMLTPVAFLDDNEELHGQDIDDIRVYNPSRLDSLITKKAVGQVLLAIPSASRARKKEILDRLEAYQINVRTLPGVSELARGKVQVQDIREIDIEDLLGRDPVPPDENLLSACIRNRNVMVTGAGGSIGSELCAQIIELGPNRLILLERNEFALYRVDEQIRSLVGADHHQIEVVPILGSVNHYERIKAICRIFQINTIYHAAAYKHVPIVERNPIEAVYNNIFGTLHLAQAAIETGVETFLFISTDKAVRPTNVMGATKRFAELILQSLSEGGAYDCADGSRGKAETRTKMCMVRFGNVLDSSGSVVPLFRKQIKDGGPVTVTHPEIYRYFMSIPEAVQLVIQAGSMAEGGEVFVLDMGEPIRILDLARRMIRLSGFEVKDENNPNGDIEIHFSGLRPGEKLYEELLLGNDVYSTGHPKIMCAREEMLPWEEIERLLHRFGAAAQTFNHEEIRELLKEAVKDYHPEKDINDVLWTAME